MNNNKSSPWWDLRKMDWEDFGDSGGFGVVATLLIVAAVFQVGRCALT